MSAFAKITCWCGMGCQTRYVVLAAEAGEGFAAPIEMPDNMREKCIAGTGGGAQWRGKRHENGDGQSGKSHDCPCVYRKHHAKPFSHFGK